MRTQEVYNSNVPAFLIKLWKLVEDSSCNDLISWSENGTSFIIRDQAKFSKDLLPLYFKHNNMASFIRQLNMYGFRKVANYERGGLKAESDEMEFQHMFFMKGQAALLGLIKRKMPTSKGNSGAENLPRSPNARELLSDLTAMRKKQENMDSMLMSMKKENEVLWKEISSLRNKHKNQEQIIQKVIGFLISLVRSNQGLAAKRKLPCILHDSNVPKNKSVKLPPNLGLVRGENSCLCFSVLSDKPESSQGPVIHEVTDFEVDQEVSSPSLYPAESTDDLLLSQDYPIIVTSSPAEVDKTEAQRLTPEPAGTLSVPEQELSSANIEVLSPPEQEFSTTQGDILPLPDEELSVITAEILPSAEKDASPQPALLTLDLGDNGGSIESEGPISLTAEMLVSPESCFIVENNVNLDEVPSTPQILSKSDVFSEKETENVVVPEVISSIVGTAPEGIANYSAIFGGSAKDVLLCSNHPEDEEIVNQENKPNNLLVAVSDTNASTSGTFAKNIFSNHVINIEEDLDWLHDQLKSGNLNIDTSTLLGVCQRWESWTSLDSQLFSTDDIINNSLLTNQFAAENCDQEDPVFAKESRETGNDITGNELVQFAPSAFEADLNSIENTVFEFLNENVPLHNSESDLMTEASEPVCDAESGTLDISDSDSIKVNFQALMDMEKPTNCKPSNTVPVPTRKRKRSHKVK